MSRRGKLMKIRLARISDTKDIARLLIQICNVHNNGRPDLFKKNGQKYTIAEIENMISDSETPIIVAEDETQSVVGYAMCVIKTVADDLALQDVKTLYLDDLCVDEKNRRKGTGSLLYKAVLDYAKKTGCYNVTLNVWCCNPKAIEFYKKCGLTPQKITMEKII